MFHRVRPENQTDSENQTGNQQQQQASQNYVSNSNESYAAATVQKETETAPTKSSTPQQKDTSAMSEKNEYAAPSASSGNENTTTANTETQATSYQRNMSAPRSVAPNYGTSYTPSYSPSSTPSAPGSIAAANSTPVEATANDRKLTIGRGITMSGEIEACDHLFVEGTVEAALKGATVLDIAESGVFYGTVEIEEARIAGRFEGDITVKGRLVIHSSGVITGSIAYSELEVESGAMIDGRLTPIKSSGFSAQQQPSQKEAATSKPKTSKETKGQPANSDGELFTESAASAAE